jgi:hypothetical protein
MARKVKKITKTIVNNVIKKMISKIDIDGEFVPSIKIETTTFKEDDFETETVIFEDEDAIYASYIQFSLVYKVKVSSRFGNGLGAEETFITESYVEMMEIV